MRVADLDDDGDADVLAVVGSGTVWYENLGDGAFSDPLPITTRQGQLVADMDGDGDHDLVWNALVDGAGENDEIGWTENLGGGEFGDDRLIGHSVLAWPTSAVDLDGDGDLDVLVGNRVDPTWGTNRLSYAKNLGDGEFSWEWRITSRTGPVLWADAADLDGDGDADVLSASKAGIAWNVNIGNDSFSGLRVIKTVDRGEVKFVQAVDLDGDNDADVLWHADDGKGTATIGWNENLGGSFAANKVIATGDRTLRSMQVVDLDGDGDPDVVTGYITSQGGWHIQIVWFENLGGGELQTGRLVMASGHASLNLHATHAADMDGDGDLDVLAAFQNGIAWYENRPYDHFLYPVLIDPATRPHAADVDGDGDMDVLAAGGSYDRSTRQSSTKFEWHENIGDGAFSELRHALSSETTGYVSDAARSAVHTADVDGDGDADVLAALHGPDKIVWFPNHGRGEVSEPITITEDALSPYTVDTADLDGDGDLDVLTASHDDDKIAWYENLGAGEFSEQRVITIDAFGATSAQAVDLDADGDPDVLAYYSKEDKIAWHANLGGGEFSKQRVITTEAPGATPSVQAADLDSDGDPDVLWASSESGKVAWLENRGGGAFTRQPDIMTEDVAVQHMQAADLDGDGDPDILSAHTNDFTDGKITWHQNLGGGDFSEQRIITLDIGPEVVFWLQAADLDGDEDADVLALTNNNKLAIWFENIGSGQQPALAPAGVYPVAGEDAGDRAGWSVADPADGSGVLVGAPFHSPAGRESAGSAYLIGAAALADAGIGGTVRLAGIAARQDAWKLAGESAGDRAGWSVATVDGHDADGDARSYVVVGAPQNGAGAGAVYLVSRSDMSSADGADGAADGTIHLANVAAQGDSWKIAGGVGDRFGASVSSAGDVDGDGHEELLVHGRAERRGAGFGAAFVLSLSDADLAAADGADGETDGVIDSRALAARVNFRELFGESVGGSGGTALAALGDVDGDARDDLVVGAPGRSPGGAAFLAGGADLDDGAIDASVLAERPKSWRLDGEASFDRAGASVASAGDVDGDGRPDMLVGAPGHSSGNGFAGGAVYLVAAADLAAADAADSSTDGVIGLGNVAARSGSWKFVGGEAHEGVGVGLSSAGDVDGDGRADLLVGADAGGGYVIAVSDLASMDEADGAVDGEIDLGNAAAQANSWRIVWPGQVAGRGMLLAPVGDADGDGRPDVLLAGSDAAWLIAVADLPGVLADIDAADGSADGVVRLDRGGIRAVPPAGSEGLQSVEFHQGPLAWSRNWATGADASHAPLVAGRRVAMVVRAAHSARAAPELTVGVHDSDGEELADGLTALLFPQTASPGVTESGLWETTYTLDLPGSLHRAGNEVRLGFGAGGTLDGVAGETIEFAALSLPRFDISFVPIKTGFDEPPTVDADDYMADLLDLLPVGDHRARVADQLEYEGEEWSARAAARQLLHRWNTDADDGEFYHGVFEHPGDGSACGYAYYSAPVAVSAAPGGACSDGTVVHGVGHNLSLRHAPGCGATNPDPNFPDPLGGVGPNRGWLFSAGRFVVPNDGFSDFMSHCAPTFVSEYHYVRAVDHRSRPAGEAGAPSNPSVRTAGHSTERAGRRATAGSIALTGSVDDWGVWSLDLVSASAKAPRAARLGGAAEIALLDRSGAVLHRQPLAVYAADHGAGGAWAARVPVPDAPVRYIAILGKDGQVLFEERLNAADRARAMDAYGDDAAPE